MKVYAVYLFCGLYESDYLCELHLTFDGAIRALRPFTHIEHRDNKQWVVTGGKDGCGDEYILKPIEVRP
jgi:hypothetical protein